MAKRLTLAEQLAQINEPAPQDFDPEDSYATYNGRKGGYEDEEGGAADGKDDAAAAARADYVDVGQSKLRKRGEAVLDSKYEGKKGSRADLYAYSDDDNEEASEDEEEQDGMDEELADLLNGGEEDEDDEDEDEDGEGYESEGGDFEDLEGTSFKPGGAGDFADDDDEDDAEEEEEEDAAPTPKKPTAPAKEYKVRVSKDDRTMVKQLKQAASADVEKGRDVKKQLAFSDSLLSSRIALQKAVQASNALPTSASHPPAPVWFDANEEVQEEVQELWKELVGCSEELFALRKDLLTTNESLSFPSDFGSSRKRKRTGAEEGDEEDARSQWLEETMKDLGEVEKILDPFLRTTVTKWSDKVLAASGLSLGKSSSSSKFKAVNQNAMQQIDHALSASTGERERLVKRTRVRRTTEGVGAVVLGRKKAEEDGDGMEGGNVLAPLEGEEGREKGSSSAAKEVDVECFDDSDWYGQVLRDLVESRMLDLDDSTLTQLRQASALARGKKVKKVVDTRASKGRKIRYHVHEKAQNFMIPVEAGHWHDEQIDELFASLLGRSFPQAAGGKETLDPALDDVAGQKAGEIEVGSLRLFG